MRVWISKAVRRILLIALLVACGCGPKDEMRVTSYRTVTGAEAAPWLSGCLVTVESKTLRVVGLYGLPCNRIQIGDRAVFNHKGDTVFWVNEIGYSVRSAEAK